MKLAGVMIVRNEADILSETVPHNAARLDHLLVVDLGSEDGSTELLRVLAARAPNVRLVTGLPPQGPEEVRALLWARYRSNLAWEDWWVTVDADEFLADNVRAVVEHAHATYCDHVFSAHANFYYTRREYHQWRSGLETLADRTRPIAERRRYYRMHTSMVRAFRNLPWLRRREGAYLPTRLSRASAQRLIFRHYQWRDVPQIELRLATRARALHTEELRRANPHWAIADVEATLSPDDDPDLRWWDGIAPLVEDAALPAVPRASVLKSAAKVLLACGEAMVTPLPRSALFADSPALK